jgi:antitoxin (DNA-binding transcriptional repressor) of toxin-antitoxin stability system
MVTATIREARARLNDLIDRAIRGEEVVLLRGSKHVVTLTPITDDDLELSPRLSDAQAARFWEEIARQRKEGRLKTFETPEEAVEALKRIRPSRRRR